MTSHLPIVSFPGHIHDKHDVVFEDHFEGLWFSCVDMFGPQWTAKSPWRRYLSHVFPAPQHAPVGLALRVSLVKSGLSLSASYRDCCASKTSGSEPVQWLAAHPESIASSRRAKWRRS